MSIDRKHRRTVSAPFLARMGLAALALGLPVGAAMAQQTSDRQEMSGLVDTQVDIGRRFARSQARRMHHRMEALRDAVDSRTSGFDIKLRADDLDTTDGALADDWRKLDARMPGATSSEAPWRRKKLDRLNATRRFAGEGYSLWSGGSVEFGRRNNGMLDIDRTSVGIASGFDAALSREATLGVGLSFDRAIGEAGEYGTRIRGQGYGAAVYGSYSPTAATFLDAAAGLARLDFSNARFVAGEHEMAYSGRTGLQGFGSVSLGYEHREGGLMLSPYGRFEVYRTRFDGMAESSGVALGRQAVDGASAVLAMRGEYAILLDGAVLKPGMRAELTHEISRSSAVDAVGGGGLVIPDFAAPGLGQDRLTLAPGVSAEFGDEWSGGLEYSNVLGDDGRNETITLRLGRKF